MFKFISLHKYIKIIQNKALVFIKPIKIGFKVEENITGMFKRQVNAQTDFL